MRYTQKILEEIWNDAEVFGGFASTVSGVSVDSRQIIKAEELIFFTFSGQKYDAHLAIPELITKGVRVFVVTKKDLIPLVDGVCFFLVSDVLDALQRIAMFHRTQFQFPVIGITGSNGKTTVKEWLFQLLCDTYRIVRNPGSFNSQLGVPLSIMQMNERHELGIFEAGLSKPGEMTTSGQIIKPDIGLFLNLGAAHDEGFESREQKLFEKYQLFTSCRVLIMNSKFRLLSKWMQKEKRSCLIWGYAGDGEDLYFEVLDQKRLSGRRTLIEAKFNGQKHFFELPFDQDIYIENAIHCIVLCLYLGLTSEYIQEKTKLLRPLPLRLELIQGIHNALIINDAYSNDPESLLAALQFMDQNAGKRKRILILSDFKQSNQNLETTLTMVKSLIVQYSVDFFIGYGALWKNLNHEERWGDCQVFSCSEARELERMAMDLPLQNAIVLIKGARVYKLERLADRLSAVRHQTHLEINLGALANNIACFRELLKPGTDLMLMLKAAAYGSGDLEMVDFFEKQPVDYVAVAFVDEGVRLRKSGMQLPVMVLNPDVHDPELLLQYHLEPEIFSLDQLHSLINAMDKGMGGIDIHLKLDTGMHRLGFEEKDLSELIQVLKENTNLQVLSVFTHLIASEKEQMDALTLRQIDRFEIMYQTLSNALDIKPKRHVLNSAGISRFPQFKMDMVRLGIGMYGLGALPAQMKGIIRNVHTLKAMVSQVKEVQTGETVGYGGSFILESPKTIATITIGYADGYMRKAGFGAHKVWINGHFLPTIGSICMDMSMIDVTGLSNVKPGDEVEIFGNNNPIEDLAKVCETISYEVLSRISSRVKRKYVKDW
jgi:alanine racemase